MRRGSVSLDQYIQCGNESVVGATFPREIDPDALPEERLALLFVCSHPDTDPSIRAPLMLPTVLGCNAGQIAQAFAVPTSTMAQRLVRAKSQIRDRRIPFVVPGRIELLGRLKSVLEAIDGEYAMDWWLVSGATLRDSLADEAHYIAVTLATLIGDQPEAWGLAALVSYCVARAPAREAAAYVPLEEQDTRRSNPDLIRRGEQYLQRPRVGHGP